MKPSRTVARFFAVATLLGVLMLPTGTALHQMSADPNDAAAEQKSDVFEAAFAIRQIEIGLTTFLSFVTGLAVAAFGLPYFSTQEASSGSRGTKMVNALAAIVIRHPARRW